MMKCENGTVFTEDKQCDIKIEPKKTEYQTSSTIETSTTTTLKAFLSKRHKTKCHKKTTTTQKSNFINKYNLKLNDKIMF